MIIDRFEETFAICETDSGEIVEIVKECLPFDSKEGDYIIKKEGSYEIDVERTASRRLEMAKKLNELLY